MRRSELSGLRSRAPDGEQVLALAVELVDPGAAVTVSDEDAAVRRDRDVGGAVALRVGVVPGLGRDPDLPDDLSFRRGLDDLLTSSVGEVDELLLALGADRHAVQATRELLSEGLVGAPVAVQDDEGLLGVRVEPDAARRVDRDAAVGVTELAVC